MRKTLYIPGIHEETQTSDPECRLHFAIAKYKDGHCHEVFMTSNWNTYCREYELLIAARACFTVWCGSRQEIDEFRKRSQKLPPYEDV